MPQVPKKEFYCPCGSVSLSHMKKKTLQRAKFYSFILLWSCVFLNIGDCHRKCWQNHLWSTSTEKVIYNSKATVYLDFSECHHLCPKDRKRGFAVATPTPPKKLQRKTLLQGNSAFLESLISPRHLLEERMNPLLQVISCLAAHSSRESLCCAGEGADQTQHQAQAVEGDELLGIPAPKNYSGVSAKEHGSQLEFTRHICRSKRFNGCETDHSLS